MTMTAAATNMGTITTTPMRSLPAGGVETPKKFTQAGIQKALEELENGELGTVLRAKGIVPAEDGTWIYFDYVPGEADVRTGSPAVTGRLCVIGAQLDEHAIAALFGV